MKLELEIEMEMATEIETEIPNCCCLWIEMIWTLPNQDKSQLFC